MEINTILIINTYQKLFSRNADGSIIGSLLR